MASRRRKVSNAEEAALVAQVDNQCPLCGAPVYYTKKSRLYKKFEIAHIYPLNPTPEETLELARVERLSADPNHPDNLIVLCTPCHTEFDKPRTVPEYDRVATVKRTLIARSEQQALQSQYPIETEIRGVLEALHNSPPSDGSVEDLTYDTKSLNDKFDVTLPLPTRQKIRHNVQDYFQLIGATFAEMERDSPGSAVLIYSQVKSYYLKQKLLGLTQPAIFANIVSWLRTKTNAAYLEGPECVASFFVQNCEVFE